LWWGIGGNGRSLIWNELKAGFICCKKSCATAGTTVINLSFVHDCGTRNLK